MNVIQWSSLQYEKLFLRSHVTYTQYRLDAEQVHMKNQLSFISKFTLKSNKQK